jgi:hypothetical protein
MLLHICRPPTVFEAISEKWNDSAFNPIAPPSECHADFQMATDCSYNLVAGLLPATPQKIEDCFTSMRSDLLRIISRWEQSGQGEGGMDQEGGDEEDNDDEVASSTSSISSGGSKASSPRHSIGSLTNRSPRALQTRAAFLHGRPPYLLYFWEVADTHQLLKSSLQRLTNNTGACDASMVASVTTTTSGGSRRSRRNYVKEQQEQSAQTMTGILDSMRDIAKGNEQMRLDLQQNWVHERDLEEQRINGERQEQSRKRHFQRRTELLDLGRKYRRLNAELDMHDERSKRLSEFYVNECRVVEDELQQLNSTDSSSR